MGDAHEHRGTVRTPPRSCLCVPLCPCVPVCVRVCLCVCNLRDEGMLQQRTELGWSASAASANADTSSASAHWMRARASLLSLCLKSLTNVDSPPSAAPPPPPLRGAPRAVHRELAKLQNMCGPAPMTLKE